MRYNDTMRYGYWLYIYTHHSSIVDISDVLNIIVEEEL